MGDFFVSSFKGLALIGLISFVPASMMVRIENEDRDRSQGARPCIDVRTSGLIPWEIIWGYSFCFCNVDEMRDVGEGLASAST